MNLVIGIVLISSTFTSASSSVYESFFNLHQATGFFEQFVAGRCPLGKNKAQSLLKSFDGLQSESELKEKVNELKLLISSGRTPSVVKVETFRLSIHGLMEKKGLRHEQFWHNEILAKCKIN